MQFLRAFCVSRACSMRSMSARTRSRSDVVRPIALCISCSSHVTCSQVYNCCNRTHLQLVLERVLHAFKLLLAAHQLAQQTLFFDKAASGKCVRRNKPELVATCHVFVITCHETCIYLPSMLFSSPCSLCLITTNSSSAIASGTGVSPNLPLPPPPPTTADDEPSAAEAARSRSCCSRTWMRCVYLQHQAQEQKLIRKLVHN